MWTVLNCRQAVFQFPPDYFIRLKSWMRGEIGGRERKPEFPGGSVSLKSQLVRMEERRGISCLFIHSNQESVEQERRLGSGGTLPH